MYSSDVDFINFDIEVAEFMADTYYSYMSAKSLNSFATRIGWPTDMLETAREWLYKDLMIIASAHYSKCDVILTSDVRTLYPMAKEVGFPCILTYESCFELSGTGKYIFQYDIGKGEALYEERKKKVQFRNPRNN